MNTDRLLQALEKHASPNDAVFLQRFFKTGEGQYGAGDIFIGVRNPQMRQVAKDFKDMPLPEIEASLESPIHEVRMTALVIMANRAKKADEAEHKALYTLYLRRSDRVNNWDLVDVTCRDVVGGYLYKHPELAMKTFTRLAKSKWLWDRRIAMISTAYFISRGQLDEAYAIAEMLLSDKHDLMHKAVGWMLRETGKKDPERLRAFLTNHIHELPRTALRYAIEHFEPEERQYFLRLQ